MRTIRDRIRHVTAFQIIGMAISIPGTALLFNQPVEHMGIVGVVSATTATAWNFIYNLLFDHVMLRVRGSVIKTTPIRFLHTALFEVGLITTLVPFIAWYLGTTLIEALAMDLAIVGFYLVYAFVFNIGYDLLFPVDERRVGHFDVKTSEA